MGVSSAGTGGIMGGGQQGVCNLSHRSRGRKRYASSLLFVIQFLRVMEVELRNPKMFDAIVASSAGGQDERWWWAGEGEKLTG